MIEEFRSVPDYPDYVVSDQGNVMSKVQPGVGDRVRKDWRDVRPVRNRNGYLYVCLCSRGKEKHVFLVHRLVLETFVGPCFSDCEASHLNGVRSDNRLENLVWETRKANNARKVEHNTEMRGERSNSAKLTEDKVREIKELAKHFSQRWIGRKFNVSHRTIGKILNGETWTHI